MSFKLFFKGFVGVGLLVILPILIAVSSVNPSYFPNLSLVSPVKLGIDLVGGGRIILQADDNEVESLLQGKITSVLVDKFDVTLEEHSSSELVFKKAESSSLLDASFKSEFSMEFPSATLTETGERIYVHDMSALYRQEMARVIKKNIDVFNSRLNSLGASDISVYRQGDDMIVVEYPTTMDEDHIKKILTSTSKIGLYLPSKSSDGVTLNAFGSRTVTRAITPFISGDHISEAFASLDSQSSQPIVSIRLTPEGGKAMALVSSQNIGVPIITTLKEKLVVDGKRQEVEKVVSYASIRTALDRNFMISGMGSMEECEELALILSSGSLSAPMNIISEQTIDARLGKDNIQSGAIAFVIGLMMLFAYVIQKYRLIGLLSCLTLLVNASLIVICLAYLGASFTLTGIAGVILTMGIAIDSNIIIFERARELSGNFVEAYRLSKVTILDANITTLIAALILFNVGSIPLKGFALTLAIGVVTTVASSFFINRYLVLNCVSPILLKSCVNKKEEQKVD